MPYKKRRQYKKRRVAKRKYNRYFQMKKNLPIGFPDKWMCKMRYFSEFTLNPGARPSVAVQEFRTSLFDTDVAFGGAQPSPFDQLCNFYKRFKVYGVKAIMRQNPVTHDDENPVNPMIYGMIIQETTGVTSGMTPQDIMQCERVVHNFKNNAYQGNGYQSNDKVIIKYSLKKFFGKNSTDGRDFECGPTADATKYAVISCFAFGADYSGAIDPGAQQFNVYLEYIVHCSNPVQNTTS